MNLLRTLRKPVLSGVLLSSAVFLVSLTVSVWLWLQYNQKVELEQIEQVEVLGEHTRSRVWSMINKDIDQLKAFKSRIEFTEGDFFEHWQEDAQHIVSLDSSFRFIQFIDSDMVIRDAIPKRSNLDVIDLDLKRVHYRVDDWNRKMRANEINITHWANQIQGGQAFLVDAPIWIDTVFYGSLTAGFDFSHDINQYFNDNKDYHIHLHDHHGLLFYCSDPELCSSITVEEDYLFEGLINVNQSRDVWWKMEFYPTPSFFNLETKGISLISLALSIFLGLTLSIALYFILKTNRQEKATKAINERLEKVNANLEVETQRAQENSRVKSEFLSNMSHEIRTPLNIIQGLIQLLSTNTSPSRQKEYLSLLANSSSHLLGLLNNILDIDKIEAGLLPINNVRFQPVKKLEALGDIYQSVFKQKGVDLVFDTPESRDCWLIGDEVKFTQIVSNFVQNALKFTNEGFVAIYYEQSSSSGDGVDITLKVKDTGIGIPKEKLSKIFERFSQLDSGYKKKYSGTGLGLAINYELVKLLGGEIMVTSEEGKGTEFIVSLPFKDADPPGDSKSPDQMVSDFTGLKALIVEDNDLNVLVLSKMLESMRFKWKAAINGELGVAEFEEEAYDIVLMDLHMPVMDGMTASTIMMKRNPDVPIIMLSANVTREAIEDAKQNGIEHYLTKPVSKERLQEVLNDVLMHEKTEEE